MRASDAILQAASRELEDVATGAGCRVLSRSSLQDGDRRWPVLELECGDNANAIRFLNAAAVRDAGQPEVRDLALRLRRVHTTPGALGQAVQAFVKAVVTFVRETRETFQNTLYTLRRHAGDCDDHARAVVALVRAAGFRAQLVGVKNAQGKIAHVAPVVSDGKRWQWAETTVDARFGEHPREAAKRLGLTHARPDLWAERRHERAVRAP